MQLLRLDHIDINLYKIVRKKNMGYSRDAFLQLLAAAANGPESGLW